MTWTDFSRVPSAAVTTRPATVHRFCLDWSGRGAVVCAASGLAAVIMAASTSAYRIGTLHRGAGGERERRYHISSLGRGGGEFPKALVFGTSEHGGLASVFVATVYMRATTFRNVTSAEACNRD